MRQDLGHRKIGAAVTEPLATRRSTAAAESTLAGVVSNGTPTPAVTDAPIVRHPSAHGSTAISTRVQHRGGSPIHCAPARRHHSCRPPPRRQRTNE
jgi:hypothetical protein